MNMIKCYLAYCYFTRENANIERYIYYRAFSFTWPTAHKFIGARVSTYKKSCSPGTPTWPPFNALGNTSYNIQVVEGVFGPAV